jgi:hypothetical protein
VNAPMRSRRESQPAAAWTKGAHVEMAYAARMCLWIRISPGQQSPCTSPVSSAFGLEANRRLDSTQGPHGEQMDHGIASDVRMHSPSGPNGRP